MIQPPWTEIGSIQQRLDRVENTLHGKPDEYKLAVLRHSIDRVKSDLERLAVTVELLENKVAGIMDRESQLDKAREALKKLGKKDGDERE